MSNILLHSPGNVAWQTHLSMRFSKQKYWSGLPCPPSGNLPDPRIETKSSVSPALQADSSLLSHQESSQSHLLPTESSSPGLGSLRSPHLYSQALSSVFIQGQLKLWLWGGGGRTNGLDGVCLSLNSSLAPADPTFNQVPQTEILRLWNQTPANCNPDTLRIQATWALVPALGCLVMWPWPSFLTWMSSSPLESAWRLPYRAQWPNESTHKGTGVPPRAVPVELLHTPAGNMGLPSPS